VSEEKQVLQEIGTLIPKIAVECLLDTAIVVVDQTQIIRWTSTAASIMFGYDQGDMLGQPLAMLIPDALKRDHEKQVLTYMQSPKARPMGIGLNLKARRKSGTEIKVEISLTPVHLPDNSLIVIGSFAS
jgi:PAS domain S-box-containing protein